MNFDFCRWTMVNFDSFIIFNFRGLTRFQFVFFFSERWRRIQLENIRAQTKVRELEQSSSSEHSERSISNESEISQNRDILGEAPALHKNLNDHLKENIPSDENVEKPDSIEQSDSSVCASKLVDTSRTSLKETNSNFLTLPHKDHDTPNTTYTSFASEPPSFVSNFEISKPPDSRSHCVEGNDMICMSLFL